MRLLFFSSSLKGGGAERVLANLTNELANRGYDITIAINDNTVVYDIDPRVRIKPAPLQHWYKGRNIFGRTVRNLRMNRVYSRHVVNCIKTIRPDIIISFIRCNIKPIIHHHGKIPLILSEHNAFDRNIGLKKKYERFFLSRFFDIVCVLTPFDKGFASAKGLTNTHVMPNPNSFDAISREIYDDTFSQRRNVFACGRIDAWHIKGFDIAIKAFARISDQFPDVEFNIAGDGSERSIEYLEQMADSYGVGKKVHFLGRRNDIQELMRQHRLFVLSSRTEGFPMVLTEAMSQGLPCVSFEKLALSIINDTIDGLLVNDGDIIELSDSISKLLSDNSLCYQLGVEGIENVKRFSSTNIVDRWEKIFASLINEQK